MIAEFFKAAMPWMILGLFTAISCTFMSKREKKS